MRSLMIAIIAGLTACAPRYVVAPDYSYLRFTPKPLTAARADVLVLATAGSQREKSAAFLAAFCDWLKATPSISERYGAVYLLPSVEGDLLGEARESISELVSASERSQLAAKKTEMILKEFVAQRAEQYRCGGTGEVAADATITVLQVAYGVLEPYGVGLRYLAATKGRSADRGFFQLHEGDLIGDTRRFAAMLLSDPSEAIALEASVRTPPEARCRSNASGLCIYQPSTIQISFEFKDSPFISKSEVIALGIDRWRVLRDGKLDPDAAVLGVAKAKQGLVVDFHARRSGSYTLTAFFGVRGLPLKHEYSLAIRVEPAALLLDGQISILLAFESMAGYKREKREALVRKPRVTVTTSCLTSFILCRELDLTSLQEQVGDRLEYFRVIGAKQIEAWAQAIRKALTAAELTAKPEEWKKAVHTAIGDDEIRDGLRRMHELAEHPRFWCDAIADASRELFQRTSGISSSREEIVRWTAFCLTIMRSVKIEKEQLCPTRSALEGVGCATTAQQGSEM